MIDHLSKKRLKDLLKTCGHHAHSHLYYLGDKEWLWDSKYEALLLYRSVGNRRIVLGDPLGKPGSVERLIKQFIEACAKDKMVPVFYQTTSKYLPLYKSLGLVHSKIGEEAQVDLPSFSLQGKKWLKMRTRISKLQRSGFTFEVLQPPYSKEMLSRLKHISDEWLRSRKEKGFSVSSFSMAYISQSPIAILVGPDGSCEAFASIAGGNHAGKAKDDSISKRITVDLMRYTNACPHGAMDVLFVSLFQWAEEHGYESCSLGMAPLANVDHTLAARLLYKYGSRMYNFKGLYEYKNKFAPVWKDVHFVYPPGTLPLNIALLTFIIHMPKPVSHSRKRLAMTRLPAESESSLKKQA
ncbi:phosphatidylglycerol lysyltransferase domain-containing protein [Paenibacillus sinopodophylli]|uniref:phosphatidylglycerol lysyltransferase domain-containing protein n=1 Tax=Paenibacillus sinopodophylli TaxID=1837342 RepID=UPI00110CABD2|nr:phosphatidylglycerol lysyltransferase domain-containing protein [Paenibacillus sinopodophylli]